MITIATLLYDANETSLPFSRCYDESWVEKLYRGFARNLTQPFRFVCFSEKERAYCEPISQAPIEGAPSYASGVQPLRLNVPSIIVGLDTVVTGNVDDLADYCFASDRIAVPRDPIFPETVCNGVQLVPEGQRVLWENWRGENDMDYMRAQSPNVIDDLFPGAVRSYRIDVKPNGLKDTRIVYFHGAEKPHEIDEPWLKEHWV